MMAAAATRMTFMSRQHAGKVGNFAVGDLGGRSAASELIDALLIL